MTSLAITKSNEMCNYLGMDTESARRPRSRGRWRAFEKGLLTLEDTGGVPLRFHDADGVIKLVEMIAHRQGVGDLLAEGSQRAAQRIGRGTDAFLTTVKGMEMAMHDPRHMPVMRASYLMAPTGGDHMRQSGNRNGVRDQVGDPATSWPTRTISPSPILNTVTGWNATPEELVTMAHRGLTLARLFDQHEDLRARRRPAAQSGSREPLPKHPGFGGEKRQEKIVTDYYVEYGWDPATGVPTPATIRETRARGGRRARGVAIARCR